LDENARWLEIGNIRKKQESRFVPVEISGFGDRVVAISGGREHSIAVCENGKSFGWGYNGVGQLGIGSTVDQSTPMPLAYSGLFSQMGSVVCAVDLRSVVRRQALFLQSWKREMEKTAPHHPPPLLTVKTTGSGLGDALVSPRARSIKQRSRRSRHSTLRSKKGPHCPECKKSIKEGLSFCNHCGHKLEVVVAVPPVEPVSAITVLSPAKEGKEKPFKEPEPKGQIPAKKQEETKKEEKEEKVEEETKKEEKVEEETKKEEKIEEETKKAEKVEEVKPKLPRMSSKQKALYDLPSPAPVRLSLGEEAAEHPERRDSMDILKKESVVTKRLDGAKPARSSVTHAKVCGVCKEHMDLSDRVLGPEGHVHFKCLKK
jgi:hypothetical protein